MDFLKNNKRLSFNLGGVCAWERKYKTEITQNGNELVTKYFFENGLVVVNIARKYEKFGVYEWVNYFENASSEPSEIISALWDCDVALSMPYENDRQAEAYFPDAESATKVCAPNGSTWSQKEFYCDEDEMSDSRRLNHIYPGETKTYSASGGRSSEARAPFFNISKRGEGYIVAVGWTGQWRCEIKRTNDAVNVKTGIEGTNFRVLPGEKFRTSSVAIMPYRGDKDRSHNLWRRFIKEEITPIGKDKANKFAPLCASVWGGMPSEEVLSRVEKIKDNALMFEYVWMDAGWYGIDTKPTKNEFEGDWGQHTGDWRVSPLVHKNGLKDVSEAIHGAGMKFLLWFEPERVIRSTPIVKEHPEYFLFYEDYDNALLNLGDENAWRYCFDTLCGMIKGLHIDCYRQDFNMLPLGYWQKNDGEERKGITEIKHINGLYRLWDELLKKFPGLLIDNCASGGRRIDIETLKRSVPLWRSDEQCPANYDTEAVQNHNLTFNLWMPFSGTGSGRLYDEYRIRSSYAAGLTTNYSFSMTEGFCDSAEKTAFIKKYTEEYLKIRPYLSEDFYPLTEVTGNLDVWCAMQFHDEKSGEGAVEAFRRERSPYEKARFKLKGLNVNANYLFTDADGGEFVISGKTLCESGFAPEITQKRKAKIYFYKEIR